VLVELW